MNPSLAIIKKTALSQLRELIPVSDERELREIHAELKRLIVEIEKKRIDKSQHLALR